jgi:DNA-binding protein YbaB
MGEFKKFSDLLEGVVEKKSNGSFSAKDETETVEVTLNGELVVSQVYIEDGLLRLGAEVVQDRINEAIMKATVEATAVNAANNEATIDAMSKMLDSMQKLVADE